MTFKLLPILEIMLDLYQKPKTFERFQDYLKTLEGGKKGDLTLPISGFNPMAKQDAINKLIELKRLNIEGIISDTLKELNDKLKDDKSPLELKVAFNLADDLKGGWTNRFTTDYDSKFKLDALVKRNFCIPLFWTSENYDAEKIKIGTLAYCYRTIYWSSHPKPKTLQDHILQEKNIVTQMNVEKEVGFNVDFLSAFYQENKYNTDYLTIFNFLYGDAATTSLGNNTLGIKDEFAGFRFAKWMAGT